MYLFYQIRPGSHGSRPREPGLAARRAWLTGHVRILYHMSESGQFMCKLGTIYPDVSFCSSFSFSFSFSVLPLPLSLPLSLSFLCLSFSSTLILSSSRPPHFSFSVFLCSLFLTLSLYHVAFLCFSLRLLIRSIILCYLLSRAVQLFSLMLCCLLLGSLVHYYVSCCVPALSFRFRSILPYCIICDSMIFYSPASWLLQYNILYDSVLRHVALYWIILK